MKTSMSKMFELNTVDLVNVLKKAALVGAAAALTFVGENLTDAGLGATGVLLIPVISVAIDTMVTWLRDNSKES